jgi:hypothetical protein
MQSRFLDAFPGQELRASLDNFQNGHPPNLRQTISESTKHFPLRRPTVPPMFGS